MLDFTQFIHSLILTFNKTQGHGGQANATIRSAKHELQGNKRRNGIVPALAWNSIEFGSTVLNGIDIGPTFTHPGNGVSSAMGAAGLSPCSAW